MEKTNKSVTTAALLLVAGGIIGAGAALLLAPQSGRRTRRDLARCAKKVKLQANEKVDELTDSISHLVDTIGDKTDDLLDKGKEVAGSARKDLLSLIEEGAATLERFRRKLRKM